jgi:transposase InsO family protein
MEIQKSSWYHYQERSLTIREQEKQEEELRSKVIEIITENPGYGYRRIKPELKKMGVTINHKRLLPLLRKWGVIMQRTIKRKTASGIDKILSFLGSKVMAIKWLPEEEHKTLGRVVYTDFTEIVYQQGKRKIYLIPHLERVTKVIVGYAIGDGPTTALALLSFERAVKRLRSWGVAVAKTYFHQDQGSAFKAYEYVRAIVIKVGAHISYSRVGTPGDNPEMESFFGRLKDDWRKAFYQAESQEEIIRLIDMAILYYNTKRIHSNHKDKSPLQFLQETLNKRKTITNL